MKIPEKAKRGFIYTLSVGLLIIFIGWVFGQITDNFVMKNDLLADYVTKADLEKQYCTKTEVAITANDYKHLANDIYLMRQDISAIARFLNIRSAQSKCPYPPCPDDGKKKTTDVADNK